MRARSRRQSCEAGPANRNYGINFSPATLAPVDADAGGTGNFANEPSPDTIMFFLDATEAIPNFAAGFTAGFSFLYSSALAASVNVYEGLNATGNLLASLNLVAQYSVNCTGDPTGARFNRTPVGMLFAGAAVAQPLSDSTSAMRAGRWLCRRSQTS